MIILLLVGVSLVVVGLACVGVHVWRGRTVRGNHTRFDQGLNSAAVVIGRAQDTIAADLARHRRFMHRHTPAAETRLLAGTTGARLYGGSYGGTGGRPA